ncbi:uncharacterized protein C2orf78-like [Thomomys bottae]
MATERTGKENRVEGHRVEDHYNFQHPSLLGAANSLQLPLPVENDATSLTGNSSNISTVSTPAFTSAWPLPSTSGTSLQPLTGLCQHSSTPMLSGVTGQNHISTAASSCASAFEWEYTGHNKKSSALGDFTVTLIDQGTAVPSMTMTSRYADANAIVPLYPSLSASLVQGTLSHIPQQESSSLLLPCQRNNQIYYYNQSTVGPLLSGEPGPCLQSYGSVSYTGSRVFAPQPEIVMMLQEVQPANVPPPVSTSGIYYSVSRTCPKEADFQQSNISTITHIKDTDTINEILLQENSVVTKYSTDQVSKNKHDALESVDGTPEAKGQQLQPQGLLKEEETECVDPGSDSVYFESGGSCQQDCVGLVSSHPHGVSNLEGMRDDRPVLLLPICRHQGFPDFLLDYLKSLTPDSDKASLNTAQPPKPASRRVSKTKSHGQNEPKRIRGSNPKKCEETKQSGNKLQTEEKASIPKMKHKRSHPELSQETFKRPRTNLGVQMWESVQVFHALGKKNEKKTASGTRDSAMKSWLDIPHEGKGPRNIQVRKRDRSESQCPSPSQDELPPPGKVKLVPLPFLTPEKPQARPVPHRPQSLASRRPTVPYPARPHPTTAQPTAVSLSQPASANTSLRGSTKASQPSVTNTHTQGSANAPQPSVSQSAVARPEPHSTSSSASVQHKPVSTAGNEFRSPPKPHNQYLLQDFSRQPIPWRKPGIPGPVVSNSITKEQRPEREAMKRRAQQERENAAQYTALGKLQFFVQRQRDMEVSHYYGYTV